jgi:hypothetical protein
MQTVKLARAKAIAAAITRAGIVGFIVVILAGLFY